MCKNIIVLNMLWPPNAELLDEIKYKTHGNINAEPLPANSSVNNALKFASGNPGSSIIQFSLSTKHEGTGIVSDLPGVSLTSENQTHFVIKVA